MELLSAPLVLASAAGALAFRHAYRVSAVGTFLYLYAASLSLLAAACAWAVGLSAAIDIGIAAFGASMAVAAGWLAYTFRLAGEQAD